MSGVFMKVYIIELYDTMCESSSVLRVCKRKEVAEYFIKIFRHTDNSRLPRDSQDFYYIYDIIECNLID